MHEKRNIPIVFHVTKNEELTINEAVKKGTLPRAIFCRNIVYEKAKEINKDDIADPALKEEIRQFIKFLKGSEK